MPHSNALAIRRRHRSHWLALALAMVVLAALLGGWLLGQRQRLLGDEAWRLRAQASLVQRNLARQLQNTYQALRQLELEWGQWTPEQRTEQALNRLRTMAELQVGVRTFSLLDAQGTVLASNRLELMGRNFAERSYFSTARQRNNARQLQLSAPFRTVLGVYSMNATLTLQDEQGRFQGIVTATLDPEYFDLLLSTANYAPDMWTALAHGGGLLVAMRPARSDLDGRNLDQPGSLFRRHREAGEAQSYFVDKVAATGERRLMAQQNVQPDEAAADQVLVVATTRIEAAVLAQWYRMTAGAAGMWALLLVAAALGLRWVQRAERRAADGLDQLERIGRVAPGVICQFVLWPDGRTALPYATRSLQPFFGVSVSSAPGSANAVFRHVDPAQAARVRAALMASASTLQPFHEEFLMRVPGEPERWLDVHSLPQRRDDGSTLWTGLVMDATALREAREAQLALDAAQQASRAKSEFLSRASHELRTPLNAVIGFSSLLLTHPREQLSPAQREQLGYIHDAGQHLLALINDLLDVSAVESGRVQAVIDDVPVAVLLEEVLSSVREQASAAGVQLQVQLQAPTVQARADRLRLKQVLLNLLSNAIKYNRRAGQVTVVLTGMPGQTVDIAVQDTGEGLTAEQRAHLFEPFNRLGADRRGIAGTGIGLVITRMLVELMHGRIDVDSSPGQGSCFVVRLPASRVLAEGVEAPPASSRLSALAPATQGPPLRLLYAEDNAMNALFVQQLLALRPNVQLQLADSGAQALQLLRSQPFDLALVDLHLGDMSGFELLSALRADPATASLRCAALTADALPATAERAHAAGFMDFITKPVDIHRLLDVVDAATAQLRAAVQVDMQADLQAQTAAAPAATAGEAGG